VVSHDRDFLDRTVTAVIASEGGARWTEYAGGYSDMVAQRGAGVTARVVAPAPAEARNAATQTPASGASARRKLSFKDKHALDTLPARINAIRGKMAKLKTTLNDPTLYARDPDKFAKTSDAFTKAEVELAMAEDEWLNLEILREEIGG
jgi:ATP-binding cassette subfamily F protein uup